VWNFYRFGNSCEVSNAYASAIYANGMVESEQMAGEDINIS
jgi:hypothetical protein